MGRFDAVDRLMKLATEKASPAGSPETSAQPEQQGTPTGSPATLAGDAARPEAPEGKRGREIVGALRPFLPAVGGVLRRVEHPVAQVAARLLPVVGSLAGRTKGAVTPSPVPPALSEDSPHLRAASEKRTAVLEDDFRAMQQRLQTQEDRNRHWHGELQRVIAEREADGRVITKLTARSKLLTVGLVISLVLVIALGVTLALFVAR